MAGGSPGLTGGRQSTSVRLHDIPHAVEHHGAGPADTLARPGYRAPVHAEAPGRLHIQRGIVPARIAPRELGPPPQNLLHLRGTARTGPILEVPEIDVDHPEQLGRGEMRAQRPEDRPAVRPVPDREATEQLGAQLRVQAEFGRQGPGQNTPVWFCPHRSYTLAAMPTTRRKLIALRVPPDLDALVREAAMIGRVPLVRIWERGARAAALRILRSHRGVQAGDQAQVQAQVQAGT